MGILLAVAVVAETLAALVEAEVVVLERPAPEPVAPQIPAVAVAADMAPQIQGQAEDPG